MSPRLTLPIPLAILQSTASVFEACLGPMKLLAKQTNMITEILIIFLVHTTVLAFPYKAAETSSVDRTASPVSGLTPAQCSRITTVWKELGDYTPDNFWGTWCAGIAESPDPEYTIQVMEAMLGIFDRLKQTRPLTMEDIEDVRTMMWAIGERGESTWRTMLKHGLSSNEVEAVWQEYTNTVARIVANKAIGDKSPQPER